MKMKKTGMGLVIPKKLRIGGLTETPYLSPRK